MKILKLFLIICILFSQNSFSKSFSDKVLKTLSYKNCRIDLNKKTIKTKNCKLSDKTKNAKKKINSEINKEKRNFEKKINSKIKDLFDL